MMGRQAVDQSQLFYLFNLEKRIPERHFLRRINPTVTRILAEDDASFGAARRQAHRYGIGVLATTELAAYRYAVVVSEDVLARPPDVSENGIIYRHVNIAVVPRSPSKS